MEFTVGNELAVELLRDHGGNLRGRYVRKLFCRHGHIICPCFRQLCLRYGEGLFCVCAGRCATADDAKGKNFWGAHVRLPGETAERCQNRARNARVRRSAGHPLICANKHTFGEQLLPAFTARNCTREVVLIGASAWRASKFCRCNSSVRSGNSNRLDRGIAEKTKLRESLYIERIEIRSGLGEFLARFQRRASPMEAPARTRLRKYWQSKSAEPFPFAGP